MAFKPYLGQSFPLLDGAAVAIATLDPVVAHGFYRHVVQVKKVGVAGAFSVTLQGSLDGATWDTIQTITAAGLHQFTGAFRYIRANLTAVNAADTITVFYDAV
jgi:hypothetical protein